MIGLAGEGAISSQVTFGFYARAIFIRLTDIRGGTVQGGLSAKWYFTDNVRIGRGVDVTSLRTKHRREPCRWPRVRITIRCRDFCRGGCP